MTLILSCITDDVVYQVSDRRLTRLTPLRELVEDESNKAVFVNGRVAFAYTGLSVVGGKKTDQWLVQAIASKPSEDMNEVVENISAKATAAFRRMSVASRYKRHAFQGVGWFSLADHADLVPGVVTIHNALGPEGDWLGYSKKEFEVQTKFYRLSRRQFVIHSAGLTPTKAEKATIYRLLRKCVHRRRKRSSAILGALVMAIRWLSMRYEPGSPIGRNVMGLCVPKESANAYQRTGEFFALASGPTCGTATFLDLPEHHRPVTYGPLAVIGGCQILGFQAGPIGSF